MAKAAIQYTADSSPLRKESGAAAKSIAAVATSAEDARKRIVDSFQMQVKAAKEVGSSQRELEAITRRTASMLSNVTEDNANKYVKSLDRMEDSTKRLAEARKRLAEALPVLPPVDHSSQGAHGVTDQQRASALLRAGGGTFSIRAGEQFTSQFALFNQISSLVFPVVGAAVFASEIARGVEELIKMKKQADELPSKIREGFEGLNAPLILNVDTLRKENDELELTIAKLEHKPANLLALALDEARINADRLAESGTKAAAEIKKLLEENKSGFTQFVLTGQLPTGLISDEINKRMTALRDLQRTNRDAVRSGTDTPEAQTAREAEIRSRLTSLQGWAHTTRTQIQSFDKTGQNAANVNILEGVEDFTGETLDEGSQRKRNEADAARVKQLSQQKEFAQQVDEANRRRLQAMEAALNQRKIVENLSVKQVYDYWNAMRQSFAAGSTEYNSIVSKQAEIAAQGAKDAASKITAFQKGLQGRPGDSEGNTIVARYDAFARQDAIRSGTVQSQGYVDSNRLAVEQANNEARQNEADILSRVGRSLTQYDAMLEVAASRTREFATVQEALQGILNTRIAQERADPSAENQRAVTEARIALENAQANYQRQQQQVQLYGQGTSGTVGLRDSLNEFVFASRDSAAQMRNLFQSTLGTLNQAFVGALSGRNVNFGDVGSQIFSNIAGTALTKAEGSIFGAFGFGGKADGTTGNPFHVVVDGASGALSTAGSLLGKAGSGVGGFLSKAFSLFPGRAVGGGVDPNGSYVVGEKEPEILTMGGRSGKITPASQLGGGESHYYTVDARGSNDPAAMEAAVVRGIARARPGIIASSVAANQEYKMRRPSTVR